ncbi:uncharacterized protein LOC129926534 isoform X2 [Biomphalaria glabrata]|nr:uncharacterized protein LOC129926534 isoform X2 [Biomphalaria glabrata]XP_055887275.1 uncharacterized protein LOC129926534 isoform X2 [Biomphalaria glabrata]XP_055887276.1 uncharacterized protein LOC129926534 isoform X2 [Biomphalaria glabrata]
MASGTEQSFQRRIADFPCMFNMGSSANRDETDLTAKLETVLQESGFDQDIRRLNYLTWIQFNLEKLRGQEHKESLQWNEKAMKLSSGNDLVSLANRIYLSKYIGKEDESERCLHELENRRSIPDFQDLLADAKAQQAYCYARIGDPKNQDLEIDLYIQALRVKTDFRWNYGLGLACMRSMHIHMKKYRFKFNRNERVQLGAAALFEAIRDAPDNDLRGQGYMNLALLQSYSRRFAAEDLTDRDCRILFNNLSVKELIDTAVELGPNDYKVLADCGRAIADDDKEEAKRLFMRSNAIQRNTKACYQLGFLSSDVNQRLALWLDALKLSHYGDKAIIGGIQKILNERARDNPINKCFHQHFHEVGTAKKDVLILVQDENDQVDKVYQILTACFGLTATKVVIQNSQSWKTEVSQHHVVIIILPRLLNSHFSEEITFLVDKACPDGRHQTMKVLITDQSTRVPATLQPFKQLILADVLENLGNGQITYQTFGGKNLQCISLLKLFIFLIEE